MTARCAGQQPPPDPFVPFSPNLRDDHRPRRLPQRVRHHLVVAPGPSVLGHQSTDCSSKAASNGYWSSFERRNTPQIANIVGNSVIVVGARQQSRLCELIHLFCVKPWRKAAPINPEDASFAVQRSLRLSSNSASFPSPPRRRGSSSQRNHGPFWIPACARMTTVHFYEHVQQAESRLTNCKADLTSLRKAAYTDVIVRGWVTGRRRR